MFKNLKFYFLLYLIILATDLLSISLSGSISNFILVFSWIPFTLVLIFFCKKKLKSSKNSSVIWVTFQTHIFFILYCFLFSLLKIIGTTIFASQRADLVYQFLAGIPRTIAEILTIVILTIIPFITCLIYLAVKHKQPPRENLDIL